MAEREYAKLRDGSSATEDVIVAGNQSQRTSTTYVNVESGKANLPYFVEYCANGPTTAGNVVSSVVYAIQNS